jgi:hypothetical protein
MKDCCSARFSFQMISPNADTTTIIPRWVFLHYYYLQKELIYTGGGGGGGCIRTK